MPTCPPKSRVFYPRRKERARERELFIDRILILPHQNVAAGLMASLRSILMYLWTNTPFERALQADEKVRALHSPVLLTSMSVDELIALVGGAGVRAQEGTREANRGEGTGGTRDKECLAVHGGGGWSISAVFLSPLLSTEADNMGTFFSLSLPIPQRSTLR